LRQGGPALQKRRQHGAGQVVKPLQHLWEIEFELVGNAVGLGRPLVHQLPAFLYQSLQVARLLGIRIDAA
jgi:hypothetical protein